MLFHKEGNRPDKSSGFDCFMKKYGYFVTKGKEGGGVGGGGGEVIESSKNLRHAC